VTRATRESGIVGLGRLGDALRLEVPVPVIAQARRVG
jgi:hypothetical protein